MTEDELGRLLRDAFAAQADAAVGDDAAPPPARFAEAGAVVPPARFAEHDTIHEPRAGHHHHAGRARRRLTRVVAPLAAAAAVVLAVGVGRLITRDGGSGSTDAAGSNASTRPSISTSGTVLAPPTARPVTVALTREPGMVGVGMPVVVRFTKRITDARSFAAATTVTADGRPLDARWYFVASAVRGYPVEGHLRPEVYWPAHATIAVTVRAQRLSAGPGLRFANDITTGFTTGARNVATVNSRTHRLTLHSDSRPAETFRVSLGAAQTPTFTGVKVIIAKARSICMHNVNGLYSECGIEDAQQLTSSGEYLHAAPWNVQNIGVRNTSNGCTNLLPADAARLYAKLEVGDLVLYTGTSGPAMSITDGIGDWDVPWPTWLTGGLVPTR